MIHIPTNLLPAPGWRAAFIWGDAEYEVLPLVAWATCNERLEDDGGYVRGELMDSQIHGYVVQQERFVMCVNDDIDNIGEIFWRYLGPGDPDPTAFEAHQEWARRAGQKAAAEALRLERLQKART